MIRIFIVIIDNKRIRTGGIKRWQTVAKTERERKWKKEGEEKKREAEGGLLAFQQDERRFLPAEHRLELGFSIRSAGMHQK